ncbi:cobalamin biosynthesis protein P47K [Candidatus Sumerlaeota bacterium]|nr:cobalamin biosynthesis protein P47K [Candidatus Sumerlaeota bacterium]
MIGGFLGAGKSTSVGRLGRALADKGLRVGLITNDQGSHLVDTANLRSQGFAVEEIAGGCFCCRFESLLAASRKLSEQTRPDVFIAEPVGSCTDLVASVSYPLRRIYGDTFTIAPLSVVVDPVRAARIFGLEPGRGFSPKVVYIYRKQLEEADLIIINKCDLLGQAQRQGLRDTLELEYPGAEIFEVSAREGTGLEPWFERIQSAEMTSGKVLDIDYDIYAAGEELLGWLNCTIRASAAESFDGNELLKGLASGFQRRLGEAGAEIAHLKMTLSPHEDIGPGEVGVLSLVRQDYVAELSQELSAPLRSGEVILNLRAEIGPDHLGDILRREIQDYGGADGLTLEVEHLECFRPGRPEPTHRMTTLT